MLLLFFLCVYTLENLNRWSARSARTERDVGTCQENWIHLLGFFYSHFASTFISIGDCAHVRRSTNAVVSIKQLRWVYHNRALKSFFVFHIYSILLGCLYSSFYLSFSSYSPLGLFTLCILLLLLMKYTIRGYLCAFHWFYEPVCEIRRYILPIPRILYSPGLSLLKIV